MMTNFQFSYNEYNSDKELNDIHFQLLQTAKEVAKNAYAPYSQFKVGAAVQLKNGATVTGVNIENASYPVGICAERSALASAISQFPSEEIVALAISYIAPNGKNSEPAFPCGMCRQFISECEDRNEKPITLILGGQKGNVIVLETSKHLLPFHFGGKDLK